MKKEYITEIRPLNRKQIKELRKANLDPSFVKFDNIKTAEFVDYIMDNIYHDVKIVDTAPYNQVLELAMETYKRTMGVDEKEGKN